VSRYEVNKVLWQVYRDPATARAFTTGPHTVLDGRDLTADERTALAEHDVRALVAGGAHPFLVYNFALRLEGAFSIPFAVAYVKRLEGLSLGDITT
jgi:protocatechuate 4,5-dioxygenase alpha chain